MDNNEFLKKFPVLIKVMEAHEMMEFIIMRESICRDYLKLFEFTLYSDLILLWDEEKFEEEQECFMEYLQIFCAIFGYPYKRIHEIKNKIILFGDKNDLDNFISYGKKYIVLGSPCDKSRYSDRDSILYLAYHQRTMFTMPMWVIDNHDGKVISNNIKNMKL